VNLHRAFAAGMRAAGGGTFTENFINDTGAALEIDNTLCASAAAVYSDPSPVWYSSSNTLIIPIGGGYADPGSYDWARLPFPSTVSKFSTTFALSRESNNASACRFYINGVGLASNRANVYFYDGTRREDLERVAFVDNGFTKNFIINVDYPNVNIQCVEDATSFDYVGTLPFPASGYIEAGGGIYAGMQPFSISWA